MKAVQDFRKGSRQDLTKDQLEDRIRRVRAYQLVLIAEQAECRQIECGLVEERERRSGLHKHIKGE